MTISELIEILQRIDKNNPDLNKYDIVLETYDYQKGITEIPHYHIYANEKDGELHILFTKENPFEHGYR